MITKNDCMNILVHLEDKGVNIDVPMTELLLSKEPSFKVLQFIVEHQGIEATKFYEGLRDRHNKNKSPLYTNIVREISDENEILTTLSSLLTQIFLYGKKLDKPDQFYKEVRAHEIAKVLSNYFEADDISLCNDLLKIIRADILVLEMMQGRRELAK